MESKLAKATNGIVMPLVTPEQAVTAFKAYQDLAEKIMTKDDVQQIGDKEFKKKSFWRKCQRFFNLSLELVKEWKEEKADKSYTYFVIYRATAPNGAFMDGDGACTNNEKGRLRTEHDTRSTAHTRAKNRAISDLVAFGEVSAEEVIDHEEPKEVIPAKPIDMEHYCKVHNLPLVDRGQGKWDHRRKLNDKMEFDENGNWYWCQGSAWHLSANQ